MPHTVSSGDPHSASKLTQSANIAKTGRLGSRFGLRCVQSRNEQGVSVHKEQDVIAWPLLVPNKRGIHPVPGIDGNLRAPGMGSRRACELCTESVAAQCRLQRQRGLKAEALG